MWVKYSNRKVIGSYEENIVNNNEKKCPHSAHPFRNRVIKVVVRFRKANFKITLDKYEFLKNSERNKIFPWSSWILPSFHNGFVKITKPAKKIYCPLQT